MIYGRVTDNSAENRDATRTLGMHCVATDTPVTTRSAAKRPQDTQGQHRDASGRLKDTPDGFTDLADTHGWGLRIFIFLVDVNR